MPSTIVTIIGAANANSYVDVGAADTFFDDRLYAAAWTGAVTSDKTRALLMAANRLQVENWLGNRVTTIQRMAWPRLGVAKVDPVGVGYGGGWGYGYGWGYPFAEYYRVDEIPQQVKDAQCELALAYLQGFDDGGEDAIDSFTADGVSVKLRPQRPGGTFPPRVSQLISELTVGNELMRA